MTLTKLGAAAGTPAAASVLSRAASWAWQHKWSLIGITLVCAAAVVGAARLILGPEIGTALVVRGDLVQTVVASGHIETPFRVEIAS